MCLDIITERRESVPNEEGPEYGWKVFCETLWRDGQKTLAGPYYPYPSVEESRIISTGECFTIQPRGSRSVCYMAGFHVFAKYEDATSLCHSAGSLRHTIRQVSYWGPVTCGFQGDAPVVVTQDMLVHPQEHCDDRISWAH